MQLYICGRVCYEHLGIRVLHPCGMACRRVIRVTLVVVKVKGLFAGPVMCAPRWTFDHGEEQLHVHLRRPSPVDEFTAQPVTGRAVGLADLIGPHAVVLLIQATDLVPLRTQEVEISRNHVQFAWAFALHVGSNLQVSPLVCFERMSSTSDLMSQPLYSSGPLSKQGENINAEKMRSRSFISVLNCVQCALAVYSLSVKYRGMKTYARRRLCDCASHLKT